MYTIVVGVDGSEGGARALRWALGEARLRAPARLVAMLTWNYPLVPAAPLGAAYVPMDDLTENAERTLAEAVAAEVGEREPGDLDGVEVDQVVRSGPAAPLLLEAGEEADLLVVGSRGFGGFKGLLLGSVSHQVVNHTPCPVVVVPPPPQQ